MLTRLAVEMVHGTYFGRGVDSAYTRLVDVTTGRAFAIVASLCRTTHP
jgi:hypothetical protein